HRVSLKLISDALNFARPCAGRVDNNVSLEHAPIMSANTGDTSTFNEDFFSGHALGKHGTLAGRSSGVSQSQSAVFDAAFQGHIQGVSGSRRNRGFHLPRGGKG